MLSEDQSDQCDQWSNIPLFHHSTIMNNHKLQIRHLNLSFGPKHILKDINLDIPERQITALIGPSGSGKSTLLRSINRMHDLDSTASVSGQILLDGENILDARRDPVDIRRQVGMVFQKPNPFPKSIFDNVAYGLRLYGRPNKQWLSEKVEESLRDSFLWEEVKDELDKSALRLSGGQQQRLCIARAIAVEPNLLLMDEPCSALDPISTAQIEKLLLRLKEDYTIVIVTHNMQQAQRVADKTAVLYMGEVIEYGDTVQVFEAPEMDLVRDYVTGTFG